MQKVNLLTIVALALVMVHCASSKKAKAAPGVYVNSQKLDGRSFHKLFVEVETVDVQLRTMMEGDLVQALILTRCEGVKSIDLIPFSLKELKLPTQEEIMLKVKESGCDAILFISLSRKAESVAYTPGTVRKSNQQLGASLLDGALNKGGTGGSINSIAGVNTQGSFTHNEANFIFTNNLYDVPSTELMFSVPFQPVEVSSLDKTSKTFADWLVAQLRSAKMLK